MQKTNTEESSEHEVEIFKQLTQDEEFNMIISKFKDDERKLVLGTIKGMVTNIERTLKKELSFR